MESIPDVLRHSARREPDRPAIIAGEAQLTYRELAGGVENLAGGLTDLGVEPGDRVALIMPNCPQFILSYMAAARLGAPVVPINPVLAPAEAAYVLDDCGASAVLALEQTAPLAQNGIAASEGDPALIVSGDEIPVGAHDFAALMAARDAWLPEPPTAGDVVALMYTAGTTGRPKGARLTHRNLLFDAHASIEAVAMTADDVFLSVLPLFHSFGATVCMIIPITLAATTALVPRFDALQVLRAIAETRATLFPGVPSMFTVLAGLSGTPGVDLSSLRLCISGGAALPRELTPAFEERYGTVLVEGYGPTEASPVVCVNRSRESRKIGSVGPPLPRVEVEIRDDEGNVRKVGEIGEICVRGGNVMAGYWRDPERSEAAIRDGWLYTGDLGHVDEDGYVYIVDRKTDMIIVSGLNVYPREVEDVVRRMPQIRDCAVVGGRSQIRGEVVTAWIEPHEGREVRTEAVIEHCSEHLARYKVPRRVNVVESLPRSAIGKVLKRELRARQTARS